MSLAATSMDPQIIILSEVSQIRERQISYTTYIWNLNVNELIYKTKTDSQTQKTNLWLPNGIARGSWGMNQELGINIYTVLYRK